MWEVKLSQTKSVRWLERRKHSPVQETDSPGFDPWVGKISWRRKEQLILGWEIPRPEGPAGLPSTGSRESGMTARKQHTYEQRRMDHRHPGLLEGRPAGARTESRREFRGPALLETPEATCGHGRKSEPSSSGPKEAPLPPSHRELAPLQQEQLLRGVVWQSSCGVGVPATRLPV